MKETNKIIITGVPNSGKSTLFNQLSNKYSITGNYPHATVEELRVNVKLNNEEYELIDTPGISSLSVFSEHELLVRNMLIEEKPSVIIQCVDAVNIKRSLLLTAQLIELNIPLLLCLNFMDESQSKGLWINSQKLEDMLKVPVIETIANRGIGVNEMLKRIPGARVSSHGVLYPKSIKEGIEKVKGCFPSPPPCAVSLLLLSEKKDVYKLMERSSGKEIVDMARSLVKQMKKDGLKNVSNRIIEARNNWAEDITQEIVYRSKIAVSPVSEKIGALSRHPVWGWPILLGIIYSTYLLVGKLGAIIIVEFLDDNIFIPLAEVISRNVSSPFFRDFLVGDYGILTLGLFNAFGTVLPILFLFFIVLGFLEDMGYISNLCVLINRFFRKLGLSGKAVMPIVLAFGCKTVATLTTRHLDSKKERYIAVFLIAFAIPCSAQMGLYMAILALLPFSAFVITMGILLSIEILVGILLNKIIKDDTLSDFIMALPPIRLPNIKTMSYKVYHRLKEYFKEGITLFVLAAFVLFVIDKLGILRLLERLLYPIIVTFLSLPIEALDAYLLSVARHSQGVKIFLDMTRSGQLTYVQVIVSIIIVTVPCFATVMAMIKELKIGKAIAMALIIISGAILIGGAANWTLRFMGLG